MKKISVAIISGPVGKTPEDITYSFVFDEAHRLAKRGLGIHVIRAFQEDDSFSHGIHFHGLENASRIKYLPLMFRHLDAIPVLSYLIPPWGLLYLYKYAHSVANVTSSQNVNLIHAHFAYPEGFVGLVAKRVTGRPLVVTLHGYDILTEPAVGYGVRLSRRFDALIEKVVKEADAIMVASSATYREALRAGADKEKLWLIPNGSDLKRFRPDIDGSRVRDNFALHGKFIVFTLRGHEPTYGIEYLIRAAPRVLRKSRRIHFVIGGDGSLRHYHERLAEELGVAENITFTGHISREATPRFYAASDVVVAPSLQEAFGLVITEAMASGKPVIGSNVGGIPDQIIDGYNGFLVKPKDPRVIAEKILYLYEHQDEAKTMGKRGRRIAEERFDINRRIERIFSLYENLLRK